MQDNQDKFDNFENQESADQNYQIQFSQDDSLQKLIDDKNTHDHDNDFDSVLDTIFKFYESFLDDDDNSNNIVYPNQNQQQSQFSLNSTSLSNDISSSDLNLITLQNDQIPSLSSLSPLSAESRKRKKQNVKIKSDSTTTTTTNHNNNRITDEILTAYKTKKPYTSIFNIRNNDMTMKQKKRLEYLLKVPKLLSEAVNSADSKKIREIVEEYFLYNVKLQTYTSPSEIIGRENVIAKYEGVFRMIPDYVMKVLPSTINHRVITTKCYSYGTMCKRDDSSIHFLNHLKHPSSGEFFCQEARDAHNLLIQQGHPVSFETKAVSHLILNEELTHIEKCYLTSKSVDIGGIKYSLVSSASASSDDDDGHNKNSSSSSNSGSSRSNSNNTTNSSSSSRSNSNKSNNYSSSSSSSGSGSSSS